MITESYSVSNFSDINITEQSIAGISSNSEYYLKGVTLPCIGFCGVIGNSLNLLILSRRFKKREVDVIEKGALLGLIALAFSDLCFCLGLLPQAFFYKSKVLFHSKGPHLYYQFFSVYYENVFIKISTGLTLLVGLARYVGICHPLLLNARMFISLRGIRTGICLIYIFWIVAMLPMLWKYSIIAIEQSCENDNQSCSNTAYLIDIGWFERNEEVKLVLTYIWGCVGYFIPTIMVSFCNVKLILALKDSVRLRHRSIRRCSSSSSSSRNYTFRITITLIFLMCVFIILVSPSEILHFYTGIFQVDTYHSYELAVGFTNILQAINFAFHFLLYCAVNATFRRTLIAIICRSTIVCRRSSTPPPVHQQCEIQDLYVAQRPNQFSAIEYSDSKIIISNRRNCHSNSGPVRYHTQ